MVTKDIQLALHAHLSQASLAANQDDLARHLETFSRDWKQEPTLEQFDTALGLLRDSKESLSSETIALWWLRYLQDIALSNHIEKYSTELSDALLKSVDPLAELLQGPSGTLVKRALQVCATLYGTVFQICCQDNANHGQLWNQYAIRIKQLALAHFGSRSEGVMVTICKYAQTVVQIQSYSQPNSLPQEAETLSLNRIPPNHPFLNANALQQESDRLLRDLLSVIQRPQISPTIVTAVINQTSALQRARPQFVPLVLGIWTVFTKPTLPAHFTPLQIRSIDKAIRIQLLALTKTQLQPPQLQALTEALSGYGIKFNGVPLGRSQQQQLLYVDRDNGEDSRRSGKRSRSSNNQDSEDSEIKRLKPETDTTAAIAPAVPAPAPPSIPPGFGQTLLGQINITQLPLHHVVDIIFETLAANNVPHLFHSFLSTLPIMRLKEGPLPMPPPGVGPPPPGLLLQRPPPPMLPGMMPPHPSGLFPPPPPHLLPPHLPPGAMPPPMPEPMSEVKPEIKHEVKKEANLSKLQLPKIPDDVRVSITVLSPKHTPAQLPTRPVVVRSDTVSVAPAPVPIPALKKEDPSEGDVSAAPTMEVEEQQRLLKQETFQVKPFEPSTERPGMDSAILPARKLLELTFERILDSEHVVSVPAASGRKMLEAAASSHRQSDQDLTEDQNAMVPFDHKNSGEEPTKVVTKADWMTIVARLLSRAFTRDSGSISPASGGSIDQGVKERMIEYICKDFKQRRELALTWLHEEWYYDGMRQRQAGDMDDREPQYLWCLYKILDGITSGATQLDAKDRGLTRFLLEVPELPDGAVDIIQKYCDDPARAQLGIACLRDVVNLRPPSRSRALEILLGYTAHPEKPQRSMAIVTAKKWYLEHPTVGVKVEEFALAQLETLKDYPVPKRELAILQTMSMPPNQSDATNMDGVEPTMPHASSDDAETKIKTEAIEDSLNRNGTKESSVERFGTPAPSGPASTGPTERDFIEAEEDIGRLLELYFSLCAKNHGLLEVLFKDYILYDPFVQRVIRQRIQPLIKSIKSDSPKLLALIRDMPKGAEMLVLRIIFILTDGVNPSPGLVSTVQGAVVQHDLNARFLIPIIGGLDKEAVLTNLPRIVGLLKGTERERRTVTDVFMKLLTAGGGTTGPASAVASSLSRRDSSTASTSAPLSTPSQLQSAASMAKSHGPTMSPSDLLIELHVMEDTVGWKAACEAMDICFNHPEIFKSEIIAVSLQQLLDRPAIPSLFMRTVIQAITLYKNLVGFVNSMILAKLVQKKVWTRPVLWKGFVRCAKMMLPTSSSVLASLPKSQLKDVLTMEPSLKEPVEAYIKAKSSGRRVGGGAAKQVNVLNAASAATIGPSAATTALPPKLENTERATEESKKEQDAETELKGSEMDDVPMEPSSNILSTEIRSE
ncbi:Symplekin tight junction protein C terminal-domain-containing protein [Gamsiella multidivaricata]|uniref:Symplekin tight junction protein C terminal-domain-containing protein n=1 Tax=Gamsiella multidivaricata TaxID=101098 RepID=UPI002220E4FA|nr:Symplekin tight junction protein C terminal-domain-containing protein [Gamsiella multidivaricata]KAG0365851.1 hypothetical protein BGZ54_006116 [Gamsiella multidivaricata]KAI7824047.1 Symplekin tight junction protein C terminal-domain-containing protein [Gamsiella multidivaricata]